MRLIVDGNSLLSTALKYGKDGEDGRTIVEDGKKIQVNSARYGCDGFFWQYEKALTQFKVAPRQTIVVWDGKNAKARRQAIMPGYKAGREEHPLVHEQRVIAKEMVTRLLRGLGATQAEQPGMEGDDVIGYLCKNLRYERNVVVTRDGDLSVLVDDNTDVWRSDKEELNVNPYGHFPHRLVTVYKALVGDSSDKIPGAYGFGDTAFVDLFRTWGVEGLEEMERMIVTDSLDELAESVSDLKSLQKIIDSKEQVTNSWRCASLHIEQVNTLHNPLTIVAGMVEQWDENADQLKEFKHFYGTKTLVTAGNYAAAFQRVQLAIEKSPFVALDIETSTGEESDEWLERIQAATESDRERVDVLGSELTGMSLTFGTNTQHTIYMSVGHAGTDNITVDQCRAMCELIPHQKMFTVIQNRAFEFPVLYRTWGTEWKDNGWHGFVPNAIDSKIGASYVDENLRAGLKERSLHHLGYQQQTYEEVTSVSAPAGVMSGGQVTKTWNKVVSEPVLDAEQRVVEPAVTQVWETRQYKMKELAAEHVFNYGCDDTICTAALHTYYQLVMEVERTWDVYLQVEQLPEYLTSLGFVQGIPFSLKRMLDMEKKDDAAYAEAWAVLREYLTQHGWDGTACPGFEGDIEVSDVKLVVPILFPDSDFSTKKRKLNAVAADLRAQLPKNDMAEILARTVEKNDVSTLNNLVRNNFTGEPVINFGSPKQLQRLFYDVIGIKPRIVNKLTDKQRDDPVMRAAFKKFRKQKAGEEVTFEEAELAALKSKASTDDAAVDSALVLDNLSDEVKKVLKAYQKVRKIGTRRSLFYKTYRVISHWRDGLIHPSFNQSHAVTRRYSSSNPNAQQWPKRGEGVEFRQTILPHHKDAVVVSLDFAGQELRLMAEQSGDVSLTSCYVGDNLRDVHSLTAVAAAVFMWKKVVTYDEFQAMREMPKDTPEYLKAKTLREDAKTVNFASQYDAQAPKIAETLMTDEETAEAFLEAKAEAFPGIDPWKESVREFAEKHGFVTTMMGARRHLREALLSDNRWDAQRAGRQGPNFKIQGSGAEMIKLAMARMWAESIFTGRFDARFYGPIHDEVVFSVHRDEALECIRAVHACMTAQYADMKIPIVSSISLGPTFGEQIECGDFVDDDSINAALNKVFGSLGAAA